MVDSNFALIDPVSAVYYGSGYLRAYQNDYVIDNYVEPAVFCLFVFFVALRPKATAMVIAGRPVHLATLFPGQA